MWRVVCDVRHCFHRLDISLQETIRKEKVFTFVCEGTTTHSSPSRTNMHSKVRVRLHFCTYRTRVWCPFTAKAKAIAIYKTVTSLCHIAMLSLCLGTTPQKCMVKWRSCSTHSNPRHLMEACGHFYVPAPFPQGKEHRYPSDIELSNPRANLSPGINSHTSSVLITSFQLNVRPMWCVSKLERCGSSFYIRPVKHADDGIHISAVVINVWGILNAITACIAWVLLCSHRNNKL
jgi:hypothetical protein